METEQRVKRPEQRRTWTIESPELPGVLGAMVRHLCRRLLRHGGVDLADELTAEGLYRLTRQGDLEDGERRRFNSTYLWTTARNLVLETRRNHRRSQEPVVPFDDCHPGSLATAAHRNPERSSLGRDLGRAIRDCLRRLPKSWRRVLTARLADFTLGEIARLQGKSYRSVENCFRRGRRRLQECLEQKGWVL